jgi:hypothetical protein
MVLCAAASGLRPSPRPRFGLLVPVPLGGCSRLIDDLGDAEVRLEQVRAVDGVTHFKYRILPGTSS